MWPQMAHPQNKQTKNPVWRADLPFGQRSRDLAPLRNGTDIRTLERNTRCTIARRCLGTSRPRRVRAPAEAGAPTKRRNRRPAAKNKEQRIAAGRSGQNAYAPFEVPKWSLSNLVARAPASRRARARSKSRQNWANGPPCLTFEGGVAAK